MTLGPLFAAIVGLMIVMAIAWAAHRRTGNAGWIDTLWTFGTGLCAGIAVLTPGAGTPTQRQVLVAACVGIWAVRLGSHLIWRSLSRPDDPRYAAIYDGYGANAERRFFWFLQAQAWCGGILIVAVYLAAMRPGAELSLQDIIGGTLFLMAIGGEALADRQLRNFGRDPNNRGRVCDRGLWRYSRHPNYFFEWLAWLAYPIIAVDLAGTYIWGWLALAAPALMYWLLVYVSGIPPLERQMIATRARLYQDYRSRTNAFFPGPRRKI